MKSAGHIGWRPWACFLLAFVSAVRGQMTDVLTYHNESLTPFFLLYPDGGNAA
jgi:hypothetical protein